MSKLKGRQEKLVQTLQVVLARGMWAGHLVKSDDARHIFRRNAEEAAIIKEADKKRLKAKIDKVFRAA